MPSTSNRGRRFPPEPLSPDEARRLINAPSKRCPTGRRNAAMLAVGYRCGLRCSEILGLEERDLDRSEGTLNVRHAKGGKHRIVGIDAGVVALIDHWLAAKRQRGIQSRRIFTTLQGGDVSANYCRSMIQRTAKRAGIEKRVHFHGLRHSCAAALARDGVPMPTIQRALGHSNLSTTSRYLSRVDPREVVDAMKVQTLDLYEKPKKRPTTRSVAKALDEAGISLDQLLGLLGGLRGSAA